MATEATICQPADGTRFRHIALAAARMLLARREARVRIGAGAGTAFDPDVVQALLAAL